MIDVACFCGRRYSFSGDTGVCPRCGECVTTARPSLKDEQHKHHEHRLLMDGAVLTSRSASNLTRGLLPAPRRHDSHN